MSKLIFKTSPRFSYATVYLDKDGEAPMKDIGVISIHNGIPLLQTGDVTGHAYTSTELRQIADKLDLLDTDLRQEYNNFMKRVGEGFFPLCHE